METAHQWVGAYASSVDAAKATPTGISKQSRASRDSDPETGSDDDKRDVVRRRSFSRNTSVGSEIWHQSICSAKSEENLWVDSSLEPSCSTTELFLENLLLHKAGEPLDPLNETVGFARQGVDCEATGVAEQSFWHGVFTLVASAMGAGCLSLPHMMRQSGLGLGLVLLISGAAFAHLSLVVLMSCARYTKCRSLAQLVALSCCGANGSEAKIMRHGRFRMDLFVDAVLAAYGVAAVLIYMMLIGDFLGGIAQHPALFGSAVAVPRAPLILGALPVLLPLSLPREVSALRHICVLSTSAIVFMAVAVLVKTPALSMAHVERGMQIVWFDGDVWTTLKSFSIAVFSFAAHTNAVPVATALKDPRPARIWRVSLSSVLIELAVYIVIAVGGYISFMSDTKQDFIRNYPIDDKLMLLVRCVYSVPIIFGVPINLSPAAASLLALAQRATADHDGRSSYDEGAWRSKGMLHAVIVTAVLFCCAAMAICSEAIADVIGLMGSLFGTFICLWWPHQIYSAVLGKLHGHFLAAALRTLLLAGSIVGISAFFGQLTEFWQAMQAA